MKPDLVASLKNKIDLKQAISSLVIAIQMISTFCKKLKYKREIVLVTNGTGLINSEGLDQIKEKIKEDNIKLTVLYVYRESVSSLGC